MEINMPIVPITNPDGTYTLIVSTFELIELQKALVFQANQRKANRNYYNKRLEKSGKKTAYQAYVQCSIETPIERTPLSLTLSKGVIVPQLPPMPMIQQPVIPTIPPSAVKTEAPVGIQ